MERWLAMELARRLGVWANPDFPFPRRLIDRVLAAAPGAAEWSGAAFEPERLLWSVRALLPELVERPELLPIRTYLGGDDRGVRALQLAERIATTFDHYVVHRPDLIEEWEGGGGDPRDWQPLFWRALVDRLGRGHVATRARAFQAAARSGRVDLARLPPRVSLFGISTLPPLYLDVLAALAAHVDVHLFILTPSREYWALIQSKREIVRAVARSGLAPEDAESRLHLEIGHPLLASLGRLGRELQLVLETVSYDEPADDLYEDAGCTDALHTLQSDMLALRHRGGRDGPERLELRAGDRSIRIHSCHGPMREVEVLHDELLALFDEMPDLAPHEVIVMTPDIDTYAPAIEAVFGASGGAAIPYRISDRGPRAAAEVVEAFGRLLDVLRGRMKAPEVLDLLAVGAIRARFGITTSDLELVREWVTDAGIRWAVDAAHRAQAGQPAIEQNTWRFGLDRLLLGYAIGDEGGRFGDVLPYVHVEGSAAQVLGAVVELLETLFAFRERLAVPRSVAEWRTELGELIAATIADDSTTADQVQELTDALADLADRAAAAGFTEPIPIEALRLELDGELRRRASTHGFLSRGVCFCELVPMRTIPFRVVCLLGMSDGTFPRTQRPLGFDLMARRPRPGDRSAREDDRYLFLEALLAARERLVITYVGQGIRDNGVRPPSVVVSELLDALDETYATADGGGVRRSVEVVHPLQPFDPRYFDEAGRGGLFSYRDADRRAAAALLGPRHPRAPFVAGPIAAPPPTEIELDELVDFFEKPSRWFARRRLDLRIGRTTARVASREPLVLDDLELWAIRKELLEGLLRGAASDEMIARLRAAGSLPFGALGHLGLDEVRPEVERMLHAVRRYRCGRPVEVEIDAPIAGARVVGRVGAVWETGHVHLHFSRLRGRHDVGAWVRHVLLCLVRPPTERPATIVVGRPAGTPATAVRFEPLADPRPIAEALLELYRAGQAAPLPFFAAASRAFAESFAKHGDVGKAHAAAVKSYDHPRSSRWNGRSDPEVELLFRGRDPVAASDPSGAPSFADVATRVFAPLLAHEHDA